MTERWRLAALINQEENMGIRPKVIIDAENDEVVLIGRKEVVAQVVDLSTLLHVQEIDGFVRAVMWDPIPHRGAQVANGIILEKKLGDNGNGSGRETSVRTQRKWR